MWYKCYNIKLLKHERDSDLWASTGIQRHRLRALFEREGQGNTLEQTD